MSDTIVAISSPPVGGTNHAPGSQPLAMLRLSGPDAAVFADAIFKINRPDMATRPAALLPMRSTKTERPSPATLLDALAEKKWRRLAGRVSWRGNEVDAHAYVMPGPKSYTRENVVELHVPGLPWLVDALLDSLVRAGARSAQPGEFTRRAFENGRITLDQAESIGKLIASTSADEARAHAAQLAAHAGTQRRALKKDIEDLLAQVELGLDFAHEDVVVISLEDMARRIEALRARAVKLADESAHETERAARSSAPRIVLVGPTNAGKSQLFNTLLKRDAAIVSAERHTTRDAIEAPLHFNGGALSAMLIDSAGSGEQGHGASEIFFAARAATQRELESADFIMLVIDRSVALNQQEGLQALLAEIEKARPAESMIVYTKSDLPFAKNWSDNSPFGFSPPQGLEVSSKSGDGIELLKSALEYVVANLVQRTAEAHAAAGASVRASALSAAEALKRASEALRDGCGEDVVAVELREAIHAFWRAEGILMRHDAVTEAAYDIIFSQFCIGK